MAELAAFRSFYGGSVRGLAAHLRRLGVTRDEDLEEVVQETYVEAFKAWDSLRDEGARFAWLLVIGRRQLTRHRERARRGPALAWESPALDEFDASAEAVPPADERLATRSTCVRMLDAIAGIDDARRRRAVELFYLEEMQLPEVSAATGVKVSTLTTWLSRFREKARALVRDEAARESVGAASLRVARKWT